MVGLAAFGHDGSATVDHAGRDGNLPRLCNRWRRLGRRFHASGLVGSVFASRHCGPGLMPWRLARHAGPGQKLAPLCKVKDNAERMPGQLAGLRTSIRKTGIRGFPDDHLALLALLALMAGGCSTMFSIACVGSPLAGMVRLFPPKRPKWRPKRPVEPRSQGRRVSKR